MFSYVTFNIVFGHFTTLSYVLQCPVQAALKRVTIITMHSLVSN